MKYPKKQTFKIIDYSKHHHQTPLISKFYCNRFRLLNSSYQQYTNTPTNLPMESDMVKAEKLSKNFLPARSIRREPTAVAMTCTRPTMMLLRSSDILVPEAWGMEIGLGNLKELLEWWFLGLCSFSKGFFLLFATNGNSRLGITVSEWVQFIYSAVSIDHRLASWK